MAKNGFCIMSLFDKKLLVAGGCLASVASAAFAQDYTDALRFNANDVVGTARTQALGGAYGAVGADLTSMSINPAGMALYRATELGLTLGVNVAKAESEFFAQKATDDRVRVSFDQLGVNFSFGRMREEGGGAVAHSFFVGYNRLADFNGKYVYNDNFSRNSLLDYFCFDEQISGGTTGALAYSAYLTEDTTVATSGGESAKLRFNVWEELTGDENYVNPNFRIDENGNGIISLRRWVDESGSKGDIPIGYAVNISNKLYVGGSINIKTLTYDRKVVHSESFEGYAAVDNAPTNFSYRVRLEQDGTGVGFNLGVIYRPINALRVGFALHSPTFFSVNEKYYADITNPARNLVVSSDRYEYEYKYRAPSRFVASVAGVFGNVGLLSFDYERTNNKRSKFSSDDEEFGVGTTTSGIYDAINAEMKDRILTASNTFRVGGELSVLRPVYLRAGYRQTTSAVRSPYYVNEAKNYAISGGVGLRMNNFFVDLAYVCSTKKSDSWVLPDSANPYPYEVNAPAWLVQRAHSGVVTFGFRF